MINKAINYSTSKDNGLLYDIYYFKSRINSCLGNLLPLKKQQYYEKAIEDIEKVPQNLFSAREYKQKAYCELNLSRYDEAVESYSKVLEYDPNNLEILYGIAFIFFKDINRETNRAIRCFNKIIKLDSKHWDAYNGLAEIYIDQNKFDDALQKLYECLNLNFKKEFKIDITEDSYDKFLTFLESKEEQEKNELAPIILSRLKNKKGFHQKIGG